MILIRALFASLTRLSWRSERHLRHKPFATYRFRPLKKHLVLVALSTFALLYFFPSVSADEHVSAPIVLGQEKGFPLAYGVDPSLAEVETERAW